MPTPTRPHMPGYGVPTDDPDGLLPWSWAEERLVGTKNFWIVTSDALGRPHALPAWAVWSVEDEVLWFSASPASRKVRNLAENPRMVAMVDSTVEVVSVEGTARLLPRSETTRPALAWAQKYESDAAKQPEMAEFAAGGAFFEMTPERAFGIIETEEDFSRRATKWIFGSA